MRSRYRIWSRLAPYVVLAAVSLPTAVALYWMLSAAADGRPLRWRHPWALLLLGGAGLIAWTGFHLRARRAPTLAFSRVAELGLPRPGWVARFAFLPEVLRIVAVIVIAVALAQPRVYRIAEVEVESIDIMLILDLSRSMEERDLRDNRLDAGQRTIRRFLRDRRHDRIGLVVFARGAMLQCPLTFDMGALARIASDVAIGDLPADGTAIGDALALALASLRRSDAESKIVILLSDGESNYASEFSPDDAKALAVDMRVKVFTILLGREDAGAEVFGRHTVDASLLEALAADTGGQFFRAGDDDALVASFDSVRATLEKTRRRLRQPLIDAELFPWLLWPGFVLLWLELLLRLTRWRRFP